MAFHHAFMSIKVVGASDVRNDLKAINGRRNKKCLFALFLELHWGLHACDRLLKLPIIGNGQLVKSQPVLNFTFGFFSGQSHTDKILHGPQRFDDESFLDFFSDFEGYWLHSSVGHWSSIEEPPVAYHVRVAKVKQLLEKLPLRLMAIRLIKVTYPIRRLLDGYKNWKLKLHNLAKAFRSRTGVYQCYHIFICQGVMTLKSPPTKFWVRLRPLPFSRRGYRSKIRWQFSCPSLVLLHSIGIMQTLVRLYAFLYIDPACRSAGLRNRACCGYCWLHLLPST